MGFITKINTRNLNCSVINHNGLKGLFTSFYERCVANPVLECRIRNDKIWIMVSNKK